MPIVVTGDIVTGTFHSKSETNSSELDVEIHYSVKKRDSSHSSLGYVTVQMYKSRIVFTCWSFRLSVSISMISVRKLL